MIRLYLVRHGIAVDHEERGELADDDRPLTGKGRRRFRRQARKFARMDEPLDFIFTSPLARAVQTAEILAGALKMEEVGVLEELRSGVTTSRVLAAVRRRVKDGQSAALVGHDPQMSKLVAALERIDSSEVDFPKGAIVRIDLRQLPPSGPSHPHWWLK